jgi:hypothetical protein
MVMFAQLASEAGGANPSTNEDYAAISTNIAVVVDGLTARVDTGCRHGVPWFARQLGGAVIRHAELELHAALRAAIQDVADSHRMTCDLTHPGTPAAMIAIVKLAADHLQFLVLGDVTLLLDMAAGLTVVTDQRVRRTALAERAEADSHPIGSADKRAALLRMKRSEMAVRNTPGGYWVATTEPAVVEHGIGGSVDTSQLRRLAMLTDGAARLVETFRKLEWSALLELLGTSGPRELLRQTRRFEECDRFGTMWPRNKQSDDATAIYMEM